MFFTIVFSIGLIVVMILVVTNGHFGMKFEDDDSNSEGNNNNEEQYIFFLFVILFGIVFLIEACFFATYMFGIFNDDDGDDEKNKNIKDNKESQIILYHYLSFAITFLVWVLVAANLVCLFNIDSNNNNDNNSHRMYVMDKQDENRIKRYIGAFEVCQLLLYLIVVIYIIICACYHKSNINAQHTGFSQNANLHENRNDSKDNNDNNSDSNNNDGAIHVGHIASVDASNEQDSLVATHRSSISSIRNL